MSISAQEAAVWKSRGHRYDSESNCLNCGAFFYAPHDATCRWYEGNRLNTNERVVCGDCLQPTCKGCEY